MSSENISTLEKHRRLYQPKLPPSLREGVVKVSLRPGEATESVADQAAIRDLFPHTYGLPVLTFEPGEASASLKQNLHVGVVLSGGQAPGGHNVIAGIFDSIRALNPQNQLFGFLGGPGGLEKGKYEIITAEKMDAFRNTGGFDIIGSGRTKLETPEQFDRCIEVMRSLKLDAVVIIGGDDSNTNAAVLAEYIKAKGLDTSIIGVPKTIDGDLKNRHIPISFGFDTAVKTYSELIGNIARDASSARKYWHFIKLMGRSASHITLEAALQTHPNAALISEEVEKADRSLDQIVDELAKTVAARAAKGRNYGVVLIPEGLIEFIPSIKRLISTLNDVLAHHEAEMEKIGAGPAKIQKALELLEGENRTTFAGLPEGIQLQLLLDRDPHGNVQVSRIDTEALLAELVEKKLQADKAFTGKFSSLRHFFGYEGRCAAPGNFDADYCYGLGCAAAVLAANGATGYIASIRHLSQGVGKWEAGGIPVTMLLNLEKRHGQQKPVIQKALVDLQGPAFRAFAAARQAWALEDAYSYPGPIQYFGPSEVCDTLNKTLELEGH